jgi:hypothetical protein
MDEPWRPILTKYIEVDQFCRQTDGVSDLRLRDRCRVAKLAAVTENRDGLSQAKRLRTEITQARAKLQGNAVQVAAANGVLNHPFCRRMIGSFETPNQLQNVERVAAGGTMDACTHIAFHSNSQHLLSAMAATACSLSRLGRTVALAAARTA